MNIEEQNRKPSTWQSKISSGTNFNMAMKSLATVFVGLILAINGIMQFSSLGSLKAGLFIVVGFGIIAFGFFAARQYWKKV